LKVDSQSLPRRSNLHWLGQRAYEELPAYCRGFDLCLMPFALNEATEYINPTKALEYMAAGRQIISTAVSDVVRNFGSVVKVAKDHDEFIAACRAASNRPDGDAIERGLQMVAKNSWDYIVSRLEHHVEEALSKKQSAPAIS
jgi:glycosyltransferase involved in cell wall biosynthesis